MLGSSNLVGTSGDGGGGGEVVMGSSGGGAGTSSIMAGIGDDDRGTGGGSSGGGGGGDFYEGDRSSGGNRWPRQETIALLEIRSDMDAVFRDSSLKGPLWEQVSRKMEELGYHRSAKKCKEKFENVYKYHKRTKEGRVGKSDGKTYRFFDQLEALEHHHHHHHSSAAYPPPQSAVPVTMLMPAGATNITVPSSPHPINIIHAPPQHPTILPTQPPPPPPPPQPQIHSNPIQMEHSDQSSGTPSSSSSTSSDEEVMGRGRRRGKKRKWKEFFENMMKEVLDKQEELQRRFIDAVEKRENDRVAREEAWKIQEVARLNREHEILVQARSMAAKKDAALISFLQKLSDQQQIPLNLPTPQPQPQPQPQPPPPPPPPVVKVVTTTLPPPTPTPTPPPPQPQPQPQPVTAVAVADAPLPQPQPLSQFKPQGAAVVVGSSSNGEEQGMGVSSSRWPKAEVEALINLRTSLDQKYQENGPKGPLWEEISSSMKKLGYNRNAKRCKEKWENINKYFKKVKESNKKRPQDSKTCPYFHQLDALYRQKTTKVVETTTITTTTSNPSSSSYQPGNVGQIEAQLELEGESEEEEEEDEEDDEQGSGGYEIVANNNDNITTKTSTGE